MIAFQKLKLKTYDNFFQLLETQLEKIDDDFEAPHEKRLSVYRKNLDKTLISIGVVRKEEENQVLIETILSLTNPNQNQQSARVCFSSQSIYI